MNRRILILCEAIAPPAYSPRIITLVEYLQHHGWHCEITTEIDNDQPFVSDICTIHQMPTYHHLIADKVFGAKEKAFFRYICEKVDVSSFDIIFCASYYYFPLQAAAKLAKKYHLPLVVDLRDIAEQWGELDYYTRSFSGISTIDTIVKKLYTAINMRQRNRALRDANAVTTVSPWHKQILSQYNSNAHLIYNGYDAKAFYPKTEKTTKFDISFIGKYYSHYQQCPIWLFEAVQSLLNEKQIHPEFVRIQFHTNAIGQHAFSELSKNYALGNMVQVADYIPRTQLLSKMHLSSILLILTIPARLNGTHGIMGTKFYEILGVEKPCLCLNSDEECLADAIHKTNAGLAATNVEEVKRFILDKYHEWQQNGYTHQEVINKEQFTRQHEAQQFEKLFLQCIQ